jgi:hypothetical protein
MKFNSKVRKVRPRTGSLDGAQSSACGINNLRK